MQLIEKYIKQYPSFIQGIDRFNDHILLYTTRNELINISKKVNKYRLFITSVLTNDIITDQYLLNPVDTIYLLQAFLNPGEDDV